MSRTHPPSNLTQLLSRIKTLDGTRSNLSNYAGGNYELAGRDQFEQFISLYETSLSNRDEIRFLNEITRGDGPTRFYLDLDLKLELAADERQIADTVISAFNTHIRDLLGTIAPTTPSITIYWYKTHMRQSTKDNSWKIGFHPVCNNIIVESFDDARIFANIVAQSLNRARILGRTDWDQVVDTAVYGKGLRMPFVPKYVPCAACKGKSPAVSSCDTCKTKGGIIDQDGAYLLDRVVDILDLAQTPIPQLAKQSVRDHLRNTMISQLPTQLALDDNLTPFHTLKLTLPEWYTVPSDIARKIKDKTHPAYQSHDANRKFSKMEALAKTNQIYTAIESYLNSTWSDMYPSGIDIDKIHQSAVIKKSASSTATSTTFVYNITTFNRYCENNRGEHKSKTIYFILNQNGCHIRCSCKCKKLGGKRGDTLCSNYRSTTRKLGRFTTAIYPPNPNAPPTHDVFAARGQLHYMDRWTGAIRARLDHFRK